MKHFIGITENGIGTIKKDAPTEIAGFFTTDQQTCYVIYAVGKKKEKGRLSFAHVNGYEEDSLIREVFDWADETNSDRYILVPETSKYANIIDMLANGKLLISPAMFKPETLDFVKSRKFKIKSYHTCINGGFHEANFSLDRYGNIKEIDSVVLPMNPLQHPLSYFYRMFVNTLTKFFTKKYGFSLDLQYDDDHMTPIKPYPREWTDAIDDSCDIEDNCLCFNKERFDQIISHHPDWFAGCKSITFVVCGWLGAMKERYCLCQDPSNVYDPLFERLPKFRYALKKKMIITMK